MISMASFDKEEEYVYQTGKQEEGKVENVKQESNGDTADRKETLGHAADEKEENMNTDNEDEEGRSITIGGKLYSFNPLPKSNSQDGKADDLKIHICKTCGKRFKNIRSMKFHENTAHTGEKPYHCTDCGKQFSTKPNLKQHQMSHSAEKAHICVTCGKSFTHSSTLKTHEVTHTGERAYTCGKCGKSFKQSSHLKTHEFSHSGEKAHTCKVCGRSFALANHMKRHEQLHLTKPYIQERNMDGEKPFHCNICNKGFSVAGNLKRHKDQGTCIKQQTWSNKNHISPEGPNITVSHPNQNSRHYNTNPYLPNAMYNGGSAAQWNNPYDPVTPFMSMMSQEEYIPNQSVGPFRPFIFTPSLNVASTETAELNGEEDENEEKSVLESNSEDHGKSKEDSDREDAFDDSEGNIGEYGVKSESDDFKVEVKLEAESSSEDENENEYVSQFKDLAHEEMENKELRNEDSLVDKKEINDLSDVKEEVEEEESLSCPVCFKDFRKYRQVLQHLMRFHKLDLPSAKEVFPPEIYRREENQKRTSPCPLCSKRFKHTQMVRQHLRRIHKLDANEAKKLASDDEKIAEALTKNFVAQTRICCNECGQMFHGPHGLNKHIDLYHTPGDFPCEHCGERFELKGKLKSHNFKLHSVNRPQVCHICAKTVKYMKSHIRDVHTPRDENVQEDFVCPQCNKKFKNMKYLKSHISTAHSDASKAMICPYCSKECKNKAYYDKHVTRVHGTEENVNPEECSDCGKVFPNKAYLRAHINTVHLIDTRYCEICGKACKNKMTLNNHVKNIHYTTPPDEDTNIPCNHCGQIFLDQRRLKKHISVNHVIGDYVCKKCGEHFEYKVRLRGHQRSVHNAKPTVSWPMNAML